MRDAIWWLDPESPWWVKTARAQHHIDDLSAEAARLVHDGVAGLNAEPGKPGETIYRLRLRRALPSHVSAIIGDALHNLRSALDCAALALAERHVGRTLSDAEERACQFPIFGEAGKFARFVKKPPLDQLFGQAEVDAFRAVQPAWLHDYLAQRGKTNLPKRKEEVDYDSLTLLQQMSNIDKHRRLHVMTWWPDIVYWGSDGPARRRWRWGQPPFEDGRILGYLIEDPSHPAPLPTEFHHEMELRVFEPQEAGERSIVHLLEGIHREVTHRVLPRIFQAVGATSSGP